METRKVQMTGGSSYMVTLPKTWIHENEVEKNDPIGILLQPEGTLVLVPKPEGGTRERPKEFRVQNLDEPDFLFRQLIGAYVMGFRTMTVHFERSAAPEVRSIIRRFSAKTIGPEIVEENPTSVTLQDLLNPGELPLDKTTRRVFNLVRGMHEDAIRALEQKESALANDVLARDDKVDRLQWFVAHQYNAMSRNPVLARKMNLTQQKATYYFLVSRLLERMGDHACRIARSTLEISDEGFGDELLARIKTVHADSMKIFSNGIEAWHERDARAANSSVQAAKEIGGVCDHLAHDTLLTKGKNSVPAAYIVESIRRTAEYTADMSELTIDYLTM